jgi:hypothetical protein
MSSTFGRRAVLLSAAMASMVVGGWAGRLHAQQPARREAPQRPLGAPLAQMGIWLDGFHRRDGRPGEQMRAIHYCAERTPDLIQCALFDGNGKDARLVGVEYVITEDALRQLPEEERALWHSHAYEVTSGMLLAPGTSAADEHALMDKLAHTYGKTWSTWDPANSVPMGRPALMMSFTRDGQIRPELVDERDQELGVSATDVRARRADIHPPQLLTGVDRGEGGQSCSGPPSARR